MYSNGKIDLFTQNERIQVEKSIGIVTSDLEVILKLSSSEFLDLLDLIDNQIQSN